MGLNAYTGWGISTALLFLFNKRNNKGSEIEYKPESLSANNATKIGSSVPVVLGRALIKEPLVSYFGDFRSEPYTEEYSAHAKFDGRGMVLSLILAIIASAFTTVNVTPAVVQADGANEGGPVHSTGTAQGGTYKDIVTPAVLLALFQWLLGWLINGRNLKTTIQKGFKYYLGWQWLVCWSDENIKVGRIYMDENIINSTIYDKTSNMSGKTLNINKPDLFGGVDESGGFVGDLRVYFGTNNQTKDSWMVNQMNGSSIQAELRGLTPLYKNFLSVVVPTAYIGKRATIPSTFFEILNYPNKLGFEKIGEDLNPAEAIYAIITNEYWGGKETLDRVDEESLIKLGQTCQDEGLGISIKIDQITEIGSVLNSILELINGVMYDHPMTGKLTFKLIRDDYNIDELVTLSSLNCEELVFNRLDWSETVSTITTTYTDPDNLYEISTISYRDLANPLITGSKTEKKLDSVLYHTPTNALNYAKVESLSQGYPLASFSVVANRTVSDLQIGDAVIVNWVEYSIAKMICRVVDIDYGGLIDGRVKLELIEDIYGLGDTTYKLGNGTEWVKPEKLPKKVVYSDYFELPFEISHSLDTYIKSVVSRPPHQDTIYWNVWRFIDGQFKITSKSSKWTETGRLVYGYTDDTTYIDPLGFQIREVGVVGYIDLMIDKINADDTDTYNNRSGINIMLVDNELMSFNKIEKLPNGDYIIKDVIRGVYDTIVEPHTAEAVVYFLWNVVDVNSGNRVNKKGTASIEHFNITTATVDREMEFDNADIVTFHTTRRSEQPSIMSDLQVAIDKNVFTEFRRKFNASMGGDVLFKFKQRDKFKLNGIMAQDETNYRGQDITASDTMRNVLRIYSGDKVVEKMSIAKDVTEIKYKWSDYCLDFNTPLERNVKFELQTYDITNNLYSYATHVINTVSWVIPQMVAVVGSVADAQIIADSFARVDNIIVPSNNYTAQISIPYNQSALIFIGTPDSNGVLAQDVNRYKLTTEAYRIIKKENNHAILLMENLEEGYTIKSSYSQDNGNTSYYYRLNNNNEFEGVVI